MIAQEPESQINKAATRVALQWLWQDFHVWTISEQPQKEESWLIFVFVLFWQLNIELLSFSDNLFVCLLVTLCWRFLPSALWGLCKSKVIAAQKPVKFADFFCLEGVRELWFHTPVPIGLFLKSPPFYILLSTSSDLDRRVTGHHFKWKIQKAKVSELPSHWAMRLI